VVELVDSMMLVTLEQQTLVVELVVQVETTELELMVVLES
jgi:hypothetical protein